MDNRSIRILVVDDEKEFCDIISEAFQQFNFTVYSAYSAQEALEVLRENEIAIVLTDVMMPVHDGFYLLDQIKKRKQEFPKVLFVSGGNVDVEAAYAKGIEGFFEKPFDIHQVKNTIKKCLMRKKDWWAYPLNTRKKRMTLRFYDWEDLVQSEKIAFGKGGIYFYKSAAFPEVGEFIDFKIEFQSGDPVRKIEGHGIVRWTRKLENNGVSPGIGVEVLYIHKDCLQFFIDLAASVPVKSFIPSAA